MLYGLEACLRPRYFDMTGFEHARVRAIVPTGFQLLELVSDALSG